MTARELIDRLRHAGLTVRLTVDGGIELLGSTSLLDGELVLELQAKRDEAQAVLRREHFTADPLADLDPVAHAADGARWEALLKLAWSIDGADTDGLFGLLHGLRCLGARLTPGTERWLLHPPPRWSGQQLSEVVGDRSPALVDLLERAAEGDVNERRMTEMKEVAR